MPLLQEPLMPNRKLTKAGGREYTITHTQPPNSYEHVCDGELYRGTGMDPVPADAAFPARVPDDPRWRDYNPQSGMDNNTPPKPGAARFPDYGKGRKI